MKHINILLWMLCLITGLASCESDGDKIFLSSLTENELAASSESVVLEGDKAKLFALSFGWTNQTLKISNPDVNFADGLVTTSLQASTSEDFSSNVKEESVTGLSKSFTGTELNIFANSLNVTEPVATDIYFRLAGKTGNNIAPVYSNVVKVTVTPYQLDTHYANILDDSSQDTGLKLYSPEDNKVFSGFIGASSWFNCLFREADGTVWHADGESTGSPFILSNEGTWNIWYPGQTGCYYTTLDVPAKQWQALLMPSLDITGIDGLGKMSYDATANKWSGSFIAATTGNVTIHISGTGKLYTHTSVDGGTIKDDLATDMPFSFSGASDNLTFNSGDADGAAITVNVPQTGTCNLTIDLSNPEKITASVAAGEAVVTYPDYLSLYSAGDESKWLCKMPASVEDGEKGVFYGIFQMTKGWDAFKIVDEAGNIWYGSNPDNLYQLDTSEGSYNLWINAEAVKSYLIKADLATKTWTPTEITQINVCGGFNGWDLTKDKMTYDASTQTWTATCDISSTTNGFYFLINQNWNLALKGTEDDLYLAPSAGDGAYIPAKTGTYKITLDLRTMKFTMEQ